MKLTEFYRQRFLESALAYEPIWEEDDTAEAGYAWQKINSPLTELFQIKDMHPDRPVLMYSLILPETYLYTTIYEEVRRCKPQYELSIMLVNRRIWLNASIQADVLQDSVMSFVQRARAELLNILDCVIELSSAVRL